MLFCMSLLAIRWIFSEEKVGLDSLQVMDGKAKTFRYVQS